MSNVKLYSKIPVTISAIQYTDPSDTARLDEIMEFTNGFFRLRHNTTSVITAEVYDGLHDTWVGVKNGDYIIKGLQGEFYPHDEALFPQAYIENWQQEAADIKENVNPTR